MGKRKGSADKPFKDRVDSWKKIFKGLVDTIQDQQRQIKSLVKDRKYLEKRIRLQHDRWVSDVRLFEDRILQMKRDSKIKDLARIVEVAKADLIIGMKQKEALMNKRKFEETDDERSDLRMLFDELSRCLAEKRVTRSNGKDADMSALKAERDFAWNQYKRTDNQLQEHVKRTKLEVEAANQKVDKLVSDLEQSQASNMEKDAVILALKDDMTMLESESRKKSEEVSRLSKELEALRKSKSDSLTPVLRHCVVKTGTSGLNAMAITSKDSNQSQVSEKGCGSSKRKSSEIEVTAERPRLFSSTFKVPKLKNSSPLIN